MPKAEAHEEIRHAYERRRAEALAAGFAVLATLGPEIVCFELAGDPRTAAPLALSLQPEKAELTGDRARALRRLVGGNRSRLHLAQTYEATRKRGQRERENGTFRLVGRGERSQDDDFDQRGPRYASSDARNSAGVRTGTRSPAT